MKLIIMLALALAAVGCDGNDAGTTTTGDSTTRLERGMDRVGDKIGEAAEGVGVEVKEARIQAILDNLKGMDDVQAEIGSDGAVILIGNVATEEARTEAERVVLGIEGVTTVRNSIVVGTADSAGAVRDTVRDTVRVPDTAR
jgi:osmotically-inducible protein OsmY